jgi:hypothetical protein
MDSSAAKAMPSEELLFHDAFGDRLLIRDSYGRPLHESLLLRAEFSAVPTFEFALNQRLTELEGFDHASFVRVRRLERAPGRLPRLNLVADYASGTRLTEVLAAMETRGARRAVGTPLLLMREILDAVAVLHRQGADVSHGALGPERILITDGKVRMTDYVMGSAIEQLRFSPERYWKELRVAVPASAGAVRFDKRVDVAQLGMIALALLAGRQLRDCEHMGNLREALTELTLAPALRTWLLRALHMDPRRVFVSAIEARHGLEEAMTASDVRPSSVELEVLGVRPTRADTTIAVRTARTPASIAVVRKSLLRARKKQDAWQGHDVDPGTLFVAPIATAAAASTASRFGRRLRTILKLGVLGASIAGAFTAAQFVPAPAMFSRTGTLVVESRPQGAELLVDGQRQGITPATLQVKSGRHEIEVRGIGKPRVFNVWISSGERVSQLVEMPSRGRTPKPTQ